MSEKERKKGGFIARLSVKVDRGEGAGGTGMGPADAG